MADADAMKGRRRYIITAIEENLWRLGTDWVDLYQVHRPAPRTPTEEILRVLAGLLTAEKVRYIGCSNYPSWQVAEVQHTGSVIGSWPSSPTRMSRSWLEQRNQS